MSSCILVLMLKNKYSIIIFENSVILFGGTVPGLVLILVLGLPVVHGTGIRKTWKSAT